MVDSVKITALQDIGANIAYTTLVPVVNMAGTPTTQKSSLQNVGNLILDGAGGSYFPRAAQANLALSVANAAQPNITSVGTLTSLSVTGNIATVGGVFVGNAAGLTNIPASNITGSIPTATRAGTVTTNAQPNITSVGTLTALTVSGNVAANYFLGDGGLLSNIAVPTVGNIAVLNLDGNSANVLHGDGSWSADVTNYGNANVANYLPTYTGNLNPNTVNVSGNLYVSSVVASNANVIISADADNVNARWTFTNGGALNWPSPPGIAWTIEPNNNDEFEILSTSNVVISTDTSNTNSHFTFDSNGIFTAPSNVNLLGTRLNVGSGSANLTGLNAPTLVIATSSNTFVQAALTNTDGNGSADFAAYGAGGDDTGGWSDLGFTGNAFSDANYTITGPGDGYVFVQGYANVGGGSLVLATGDQGTTKDIVFSTGGFLSSNEFARIDHANSLLHLTRVGSGIKFQDGSVQNSAAIVWTTAPVSNTSPGTPGQAAYDAGGNLFVCVATNTWSKFSGTTSW